MSTTPAPIIVRAQVIDAGAVQTSEVHVDPRDAASNPGAVSGLLHDCAHRVALAVGVAPDPTPAAPADPAEDDAEPMPDPSAVRRWRTAQDVDVYLTVTKGTPDAHPAVIRTSEGASVILTPTDCRSIAVHLQAMADAWEARHCARPGDQ